MYNPNKFFKSKPFNPSISSLDTEWEHNLKEKTYNEWKSDFKQYLEKSYIPDDISSTNKLYEQFLKDLEEFGIKSKYQKGFYFPTADKVQKGDFGEALGSYILENCFKIEFPALPWARKITPNKPISNFDLIGYNYDGKEISNFIICSAKLSPKKDNLKSLINKACREFEELTNEDIIIKLLLYRRAFKSEFKIEIFFDAFRKHLITKNTIKILGLFTGPKEIILEECGLNFKNVNNIFPSYRHLLKHFNLNDSIKYLFESD